MKVSELNTPEDVRRWAARIRGERVSETGRALVDLLEKAVIGALNSEGDTGARLYLAVDKLVRASFQADKQHNDNTLEQLRSHLATGAELAASLDEVAH